MKFPPAGKLFLLLFFVIIGVVYFLMLAPSVSSLGDSGELAATAWSLGIAHPPGYPLYILIAHLFTFLPWGSVAWRVNLFAAVSHLGALVFFYLILRRLGLSLIIAVGGTAVLAFSYLFWLYSLVAEVFSLNNFFALVLIYVGLLLSERAGKLKSRNKAFLILALISGLAVFHHQTIVLIFPALAYLIWPFFQKVLWPNFRKTETWRLILLAGLLFFLGALPYLFFLWRLRSPVAVTWDYLQTPGDIIKFITRWNYGTFNAMVNRDPAIVSLVEKVNQLIVYGRLLTDDFLVYGWLLAGLGLVFLARFRRWWLVFLLLGFIISGPFFLSYANFPYYDTTGTGLAVLERFYLLPNIFFALLIAAGVWALEVIFRRFSLLRIIPALVLVFYIGLLAMTHGPTVNQRNNYLARDLGRNILNGAPPKALLAIGGDVPAFSTLYVRYAENYRPDVDLVTINLQTESNAFRYLKTVRPGLDFDFPKASTMSGLIEANYGRVPIVSFISDMRLPGGFVASPAGLLLQIQRRDALADYSAWLDADRQAIEKYKLPAGLSGSKTLTTGDFVVIGEYLNMYLTSGHFCGMIGDYQCAAGFYSAALRVDPMRFEAIYWLARTLAKEGDCAGSESRYQQALKLNPKARAVYEELQVLARECFYDDQKAAVYEQQKQEFLRKVLPVVIF